MCLPHPGTKDEIPVVKIAYGLKAWDNKWLVNRDIIQLVSLLVIMRIGLENRRRGSRHEFCRVA